MKRQEANSPENIMPREKRSKKGLLTLYVIIFSFLVSFKNDDIGIKTMKRQRHQTSYRKKICIYDSSMIRKAQPATRMVGFFALACVLIT